MFGLGVWELYTVNGFCCNYLVGVGCGLWLALDALKRFFGFEKFTCFCFGF